MVFTSVRQSDEQAITITVRLVGDMLVGDYHYIQFFNIIMRRCFEYLNLKLIGRNFFDPENKVSTSANSTFDVRKNFNAYKMTFLLYLCRWYYQNTS